MTGVARVADRARQVVTGPRQRWRRRRVVALPLPGGGTLRWRQDERYPAAMLDGTYESGLVAHLHESLTGGGRLLDLGANSGYLSFLARSWVGDDGRVVAVEPHPENLATLRDRQALNPDLPIEVVPAAVASTTGTVTLHVTRNLANARIDAAGWSHEKPVVDTVTVAARTLDDLVSVCAPDVVKVDIEGAEGAVLDGSAGPGVWPTRPLFLVEYHGHDNRDRCLAAARRWGWSARDEPDDGELPAGLLVLRAPA